jgi:chromosome segregation ATPase
MSYQAVNGTRQAPRNFKEGTLEIGKMHFTNPQDRITKEMIMDYQKTEQEKHSNQEDSFGNKLLYEPTGLSDIIDVYKPIDYAPLGKAATEDDVRTYEDDFLQLHYDLGALKNNYDNKQKEYLVKITEHNEKVAEINATLAESRTVQQNLINLKKELKETEDKILAHNGSLPTGATPSNKFTKSLNWLTSKETKLNNDIIDAELLYNTTIPDKLVVKRAELVPLAADYPKLQAERNAITVDIKKKEKDIPAKEVEIRQLKQNIIQNKEEIQKVNNKNKDTTRKYTETFNMANRDRYSVQQDPNEADQDYLDRIKQIESATYDPNIFKEKASNEGNLKFMTNLRKSLRDEVKISEIVKTFDAQEVFIINSNWNTIQEQLEIIWYQ